MKVSRKGMKRTTKLTRTVLPPGRRGRNKRGTCLHKSTEGARHTVSPSAMLQTGYAPTELTAYRMSLAKVKGTKENRS